MLQDMLGFVPPEPPAGWQREGGRAASGSSVREVRGRSGAGRRVLVAPLSRPGRTPVGITPVVRRGCEPRRIRVRGSLFKNAEHVGDLLAVIWSLPAPADHDPRRSGDSARGTPGPAITATGARPSAVPAAERGARRRSRMSPRPAGQWQIAGMPSCRPVAHVLKRAACSDPAVASPGL